MKVIIVICALVKVYNMKKKTSFIGTVVSITSLYIFGIFYVDANTVTPIYIPSKSFTA